MTADISNNPVGSGPYMLSKWNKNQNIRLVQNKLSILYQEDSFDEIIFKIVSDYNARLIQLKNGEIDFLEQIQANDYQGLVESSKITTGAVKGREYDYLAWNNIDIQTFNENKSLKPHSLFGSRNVRKALTMAVDRELIVNEYLQKNGIVAVGPIAPIFKNFVDLTQLPLAFNSEKAKELLVSDGWTDTDGNGILDREGIEFEFTLSLPGGNPLREYAATIVKSKPLMRRK